MGPIIIVGGGIIGASVAYHLRTLDRQTILFEKNDLLGSGTTHESIANLGLNYPSPLSFRRYSRDHYHSLIDRDIISFVECGSLDIRETQRGGDELQQTAADLEQLEHRAEIVNGSDLRDFGIEAPAETRALYVPEVGYLDPAEIISYWINEARSAGVEIRTGTEVTDVVTDDGAVTGVETDRGSEPAGTVINAAGQWAPYVNDLVGVTLPLRHNHGPILVLETDERISLPATALPNNHYFREEGETKVFAGRRGAPYPETELLSPGDSRSVPESFYFDVFDIVESWIPRLADADVVNEWLGMRTITPDKLPILGESSVSGFYAACGLSGKGITLAPAVGSSLADLLRGDESAMLHDVSPQRFGE